MKLVTTIEVAYCENDIIHRSPTIRPNAVVKYRYT